MRSLLSKTFQGPGQPENQQYPLGSTPHTGSCDEGSACCVFFWTNSLNKGLSCAAFGSDTIVLALLLHTGGVGRPIQAADGAAAEPGRTSSGGSVMSGFCADQRKGKTKNGCRSYCVCGGTWRRIVGVTFCGDVSGNEAPAQNRASFLWKTRSVTFLQLLSGLIC